MATPVNSVLVLGAGELGMALLEALALHPRRQTTKLAVLLRQSTVESSDEEKRSKIEQLQSWNVAVEPADVLAASVEDLAAIFGKYHTVVSCTGMELPSGTQTKLAKAISQSQASRYFPWQFGMDYEVIGQGSSQDLFDEQLEVRRLLREQKTVDWVIVSTGLFMSFLFVEAFGVVELDKKIVRALGSWDNRITVTTPKDIGRVTADVILDPRQIKNEVVYTAGDTIEYGQLADVLDHVYGSKFTRELWDLDILKRQMAEDPNVMVKYRDTFAQGVGVAWDMARTVNAERGIKMTDLRDYLEALKK
ncbi:hypothetical protein VHEMI02206 [[Torrubiella] hemipterigena]|uniref:NmrA-like domain-containing protein n=1 Tax=[Torrubiella] hemipterigena TaxID=1531966 RepID=A0A0A1T7J3_9HYPO|nr:hypothetical protein VHEMI02206 [[Torrubiella] hemipterigena]